MFASALFLAIFLAAAMNAARTSDHPTLRPIRILARRDSRRQALHRVD
jgi:hypothetical protein